MYCLTNIGTKNIALQLTTLSSFTSLKNPLLQYRISFSNFSICCNYDWSELDTFIKSSDNIFSYGSTFLTIKIMPIAFSDNKMC